MKENQRAHRTTGVRLFRYTLPIGALLWIGMVFLGCDGCRRSAPRRVVPAFYHWKTRLELPPEAVAYLDALRCRELYVKVLDIGKASGSGSIEPYAQLEIPDSAGLGGRRFIPCIFITNSVFREIPPERIDWLAGQIATYLDRFYREHPWLENTGALQIDCDWTPSTRASFFQFLEVLQARMGAQTALSATIRLHQYRSPRTTGVPPVDRGMLMLYNTGAIDDPEEDNSIFSPADVRRYLDAAPARYPLPLDVALPIFSWSLVYRNDKLWKILPGLTSEALADSSCFRSVLPVRAATPVPRWEVVRPTLREGHYLRPGDRIRRESMSPAQLRDAAGLAARLDLASDARVAFYHLDTVLIRQFPVGYLDDACRIVQKSSR